MGDCLSAAQAGAPLLRPGVAIMKTFHCSRCGNLVFFENVTCERCDAMLGFVPDRLAVEAFEAAGEDRWRRLGADADAQYYRQCHNYAEEGVCNWMVPADAGNTLCTACQLTHNIPDLSIPENRHYWYKLETAKRRLLYTLSELGLAFVSREMDPAHGLQFDFLANTGGGRHVLTGHTDGLVTMNIAEADDAHREKTRAQMAEPYRTLLGHFRHEVGHYYFNRLVAGTDWIGPFREL